MTTGALRNRLLALLKGTVQRGVVCNLAPELGITSAAIPNAARIYWTRVREGGTISKVRFQVITASGNMCIAVARDNNGQPGDRIATTGSFLCPGSGTTTVTGGANGDHEVALDATVTVKAGDWLGIASDVTSAVLRCTTGSGAVDTALAAGSAYRETIASGSPAIPTTRAALTPHFGRNWLIVGV